LRNAADISFKSYAAFSFVKNPITTSVSHKMRMPRSAASHASAIARAVLFPSLILVKTSSSMAAFIAAER
jgi:hypothetical protein